MDQALFEEAPKTAAKARRRVLEIALFLAIVLVLDRAAAAILLRGFDRVFGLDQPASVLLVGASHTVLAVDNLLLRQRSGLTVAKYAREGASLGDRVAMIRHYLERYPGAVKAVVLDVDANVFNPAGLSSNSYQNFFPHMDAPVIRDHLELSGVPALQMWVRRILETSRFNETTLGYALRGLTNNIKSYKTGTVDLGRLRKEIRDGRFRRIELDPVEIARLENLITFLGAKGVTLLLVNYPTVDVINDAEPDRYAQVMALLAGYASREANVHFLDYNPEFASRHELFFDPIHLNVGGRRELTLQLAHDLREFQW